MENDKTMLGIKDSETGIASMSEADIEIISNKLLSEILTIIKPDILQLVSIDKIKTEIQHLTSGKTHIPITFLAQAITNMSSLCEKCGNCCRVSDLIILDNEDVDNIMLRFSKYKNYIKQINGKFYIAKTKPCMFLKNNRCSIYSIKPHICSIYPFVNDSYGVPLPVFYNHCKVAYNFQKAYLLSFITVECLKISRPDLLTNIEAINEKRFECLNNKESIQNKLITAIRIISSERCR